MRDFLSRTPFFRLTLALSLGIAATQFGATMPLMLIIGGVGTLLVLLYWFVRVERVRHRIGAVFALGVLLLLFALGGIFALRREASSRFPLLSEAGLYVVEVIEQPMVKPNSVQCKVLVHNKCDSANEVQVGKRAVLYVAKDSIAEALVSGDILAVSTTFALPQPSGNPMAFDYAGYLLRKGYGATAYCAAGRWRHIAHVDAFTIRKAAEAVRMHLLRVYEEFNITGGEYGIVSALTLGYKDALSDDLRESFSATGAMHVLAVSGLHVGIIFYILSLLLAPLDRWRRTKLVKGCLIILLLWCYALVTGLSPSVTRATLMFSIIAFANMLHRQASVFNTIFFSAFILLLINPFYLTEVGFQLSYSAVIAIVYFQPKLSGVWRPHSRVVRWCWDLACVSLVAQVGTAPLAIYYFHQFPNYFLLTNFIVIPAATIIIYLAFLLFVVSPVPYLSVGVAWLLNAVLQLLQLAIRAVEQLPGATSQIWLSGAETLLLYAIVLCVMVLCYRVSFRAVFASLALGVVLALSILVRHYNDYCRADVVVFQHNKANVVNFVSGCENWVVTNDSAVAVQLAGDYWLKRRATVPQFLPDSALSSTALLCEGERYLCLSQNLSKHYRTDSIVEVDKLVLPRRFVVDSLLLTNFVRPREVIVPKCVSPYYSQKARAVCEALTIACSTIN